jgi:hypothetical protein
MSDLTPDQRKLLELLEQIARLPSPLVEADFGPLADRAVDLIEAQGRKLRDEVWVDQTRLILYERGLRQDGHALAADGLQLMIEAYRARLQAPRCEEIAEWRTTVQGKP